MISDTQPGMLFTPEGNVHVCLDFDDAADLGKGSTLSRRGGNVTMPVQDNPAPRRRHHDDGEAKMSATASEAAADVEKASSLNAFVASVGQTPSAAPRPRRAPGDDT